MKKILLPAFILAGIYGHGQPINNEENTRIGNEMNRHVFRAAIDFLAPEEDYVPVVISYETALKLPFTLLFKAGPTFYSQGSTIFGDNQYSINAYSTAEFRYYFDLKRRIKKKNAINFSADYFAIEQYILSNPLMVVNQPKKEGTEGSAGMFLYAGFQRQYSRLHVNIFFGPRIYGKDFGWGDRSLSNYRGGVSAGIVF